MYSSNDDISTITKKICNITHHENKIFGAGFRLQWHCSSPSWSWCRPGPTVAGNDCHCHCLFIFIVIFLIIFIVLVIVIIVTLSCQDIVSKTFWPPLLCFAGYKSRFFLQQMCHWGQSKTLFVFKKPGKPECAKKILKAETFNFARLR